MTSIQEQTLRRVATVTDVAEHFGVAPERAHSVNAGALPFAIHNVLTKDEAFDVEGLDVVSFTVSGLEFHVLRSVEEVAWARIGLRGHRLAAEPTAAIDVLRKALELIAGRPNAIDLVHRFVTTFVWVEGLPDRGSEPALTSCSLPDLPLAAFISNTALRHIPPTTVADVPSVRYLAENVYHEAVHQYVNYRILTEGLFVDHYDSRSSPKIPIAWRSRSVARNRAWELDRVLHAATVYAQLLDWRWHELATGTLTEDERTSISAAARDAVEASRFLAEALTQHVEWFTPHGALFVGRLVQSVEQRARLVDDAVRLAAPAVVG